MKDVFGQVFSILISKYFPTAVHFFSKNNQLFSAKIEQESMCNNICQNRYKKHIILLYINDLYVT